MTTHMDYFDSLCKISRAFASAENRDTLLTRIVESAVDTMNAKAASLFLENAETDTFVPAAQTGLSPNYLHAPPEKAAKPMETLKKEGYIYIRDATTDERSANHDAKAAEAIKSILVVPVIINNRVMGVLSLYTAEIREFSNDEVKFLTALAEQGGMAIDRSRLITQLRHNARMFRDLSAGINASLDIAAILRVMTEEVGKALKAKGATIRLVDEKENKLKLTASHGLSDAYLNKGDVSEDKGIAEAMNGKTTIINDVSAADGIKYLEEKQNEGIVTILAVPICVKHDVIGVLRLYFGAHRQFYEDEIMMVEALGHQGGLAIQNASCYLRLESDMRGIKDDVWRDRSR
ncbi:MAG TPA: GAF domain-containing protein [Desulfosalsimonadaceae bacterium]|nr:GAF domain-containing protein [Desulfosalsimonadaceae bacterium]